MKNDLLSLSTFCLFLLLTSCSSDSENEIPPPDITAPQLSFSIAGFPNASPASPIVVSNQLDLIIDAQDSGGLEVIEAFINEEKVGEDRTEPFRIVIDITGYASKTFTTGKYKEYTLKIVATDIAGNTSSQEQVINIDNELPVISEVNLDSGTVINGDQNEVSFSVSDNENLVEVLVFLNGEEIQINETGPYTVNINTLTLNDGENSLRIEAVDEAGNRAVFELPFISDNTGPEIAVEQLVQGQILDTVLTLSPIVSDPYSEIIAFTLSLNGDTLITSSSSDIEPLVLDAEARATGPAIFGLSAVDALGNESTLQVETTIKRRLFTAQFETGFLETDWIGFWILVSELDGSFITLAEVPFNATSQTVHAPGEFALDKEYMVTFITEEDQGSWRQPHMTNIQNISRSNFTNISFRSPFGEQISSNSVPMSGFLGVEIIEGRGSEFGYQAGHDPDLTQLDVEVYSGNGYGTYSSIYLIGYDLGESPSEYGYYKLEDPLVATSTIQRSDFITGNTTRGNLDFSNNPFTNEDRSLYIYGYEDQQALEDNSGHMVFNGERVFGFSGSIDYAYPDVFEYYKHHFRLNTYNTYRDGLPPASYTIPNWSLDLVQNGSEIVPTVNGTNLVVGRVFMEIGNATTGSVQMPVIFNPNSIGNIYLPQLPEALDNLAIYEVFQNETYSITNGDITTFSTINSYEEYLEEVIRGYKEHTEVAPVMETMLYRNGFLFNQWSFKYW